VHRAGSKRQAQTAIKHNRLIRKDLHKSKKANKGFYAVKMKVSY
jgi:hypothetical protein